MDTLLKDLRYGVRYLVKQPAFTIVAVLTLALGIGANTTIFSVIYALILNPPLFTEPERVVAVWETGTEKRTEGALSFPNLQDWQSRAKSFEAIAAYKPNPFNLVHQDDLERVQGMEVTANFFPLLKVAPLHGRNFTREEERPESQPVAIISYDFWQTRFGGDEAALSQSISLGATPHTIIGILPPGFEFPLSRKDAAIYITVRVEGGNLVERGAHVLLGIARLRPGVPLAQAQTEIATIASSLANEYPKNNKNTTAYLVVAGEQIVNRDVRHALWLLLGAVGFILLIACTNTANLLLVRASARHRETAIRAALGASRWRIARQSFTESLLLSLLAGGAGVLIAVWGLKALKYFGADQLPRLSEVQINLRVLLFTLGVSMLSGLLFGAVPTFKASRPDVNEVLKSGTKAMTSGASLRHWRNVLIVAEIALSLVLTVGAGLMIKSFAQLVNVPPGFDAKNVLTGRVSLSRANTEKPEARVAYVNQTLERLRAIPGVESAAFVAPMPFSGDNIGSDFRIEGRPPVEDGNDPTANNRSITPEYFQTMKIPLLRGRYFNEQDQRGGVGSAIINQTLVQRYFPGEDPIGKRIFQIGANQNEGDPERWEIVGVVGDVHHSSLTRAARPEIYLPYQQNSWNWGNFLVRTNVPPATLAGVFRQQIRAVDRRAPITDIRPLTEAISLTVTQPRFYTFLFVLFGAIGLLLTMTGVYALISYTVTQRTQEIGIRMALGATRQNVVRLVLREGLVLAVLGAVLGLGVAFGLSRLIESLLFEVKPTDLLTFGGSTAVLFVCALLASYVPARRATKVDPLVALRYE